MLPNYLNPYLPRTCSYNHGRCGNLCDMKWDGTFYSRCWLHRRNQAMYQRGYAARQRLYRLQYVADDFDNDEVFNEAPVDDIIELEENDGEAADAAIDHALDGLEGLQAIINPAFPLEDAVPIQGADDEETFADPFAEFPPEDATTDQ